MPYVRTIDPVFQAGRPIINLQVLIGSPGAQWPVAVDFLVDTGADAIIIPISRALRHNIPFRRSKTPTNIWTVRGSLIGHPGMCVVRLCGQDFHWRCYFTEGQITSPTSKPSDTIEQTLDLYQGADETPRRSLGDLPPILLGRDGVLTDFQLILDAYQITLLPRTWPGWRVLLWKLCQRVPFLSERPTTS
jgi:hypothetical protein